MYFLKAFNYIDSDGVHVITKDVFCEDSTRAVLELWIGFREDWEEEFDSIDMTNKKGEGKVLFRVSIAGLFKETLVGQSSSKTRKKDHGVVNILTLNSTSILLHVLSRSSLTGP